MKESFCHSLLLTVWELWEKMFAWLLRVQEVQPGGLFRLNIRRYHGPVLTLQDSTVINPGDPVGELHLSNRDALRLQLKYSNRVRATMAIKKELSRNLTYLACRVATRQVTPDVEAYYGITLFHRGMRSLGFEVREFPSPVLRWLYQVGQLLLLSIYHPAGLHRFRQGRHKLTCKYIWLSRKALLRDFLPAGKS